MEIAQRLEGKSDGGGTVFRSNSGDGENDNDDDKERACGFGE